MHPGVATVTLAIGREQLLADLTSLVARERGVTLTGPGGIGKTTVAMALARREDRPDRPAVFVDLSGVERGSGMSVPVATAMAVSETADADLERALDDRLASRASLLVLDNLEQVVDAHGWIDSRLTASPGLRILATSRVPVRYTGEHEQAVPPLELPAKPTAEAVAASPAGALFLERCRELGRQPRLDAASSADLFRLLDRLDGIPLAIELAAGRSRVLSPAAMLSRLASPELLARDGRPDDRHRSLETVLRWSIDLLTPSQRQLLEALTAWTGAFDTNVAEALAQAGGDVLSDLDGLVEAGLVRALDGPDGEIRFRVLETVRATVTGRDDDARRAVAAAWLADQLDGWSSSLSSVTAGGSTRFAESRPAIDDLTERLPAANLEAGHRLSAAAGPYWVAAGVLREAEVRLVAATSSTAIGTRMRARLGLALVRNSIRGGDAGIAELDEALELARTLHDPVLTMQVLLLRASLAIAIDDPGGDDWLKEALDIARRTGRRHDVLYIRTRLADVGQDPADARAQLSRLLPDVRADGDLTMLCSVLNDLAANEAMTGRNREALTHALEAAEIHDGLDQPIRAAWTRMFAAAAAGRLGLVPEAASNLAISAEVAITAGPKLQGLVVSQSLPPLTVLGQARLAARCYGAFETVLETSRITLSPGEAALRERDADLVRQITNPVRWRQEVDAGRVARLEEVVAQVAEVARRAVATSEGPAGAGATLAPLTRRENQILALVGRGLSDAAIAQELSISPKTASVHVANVKAKLGVESRVEAALRARELGID
jgi:predicted ATPase/DNA-binding CsgD family transcriptional regulator